MNETQERTSIRWFYIKEPRLVSIQISPLVLVQIPFNLLEKGYLEMKEKHDQKIITKV